MLAANAAHHSLVLVGFHVQDDPPYTRAQAVTAKAFTMNSRILTHRRSILRSVLALVATLICFDISPARAEGPGLKRITMATFTSPDLASVERDYSRWLGYQVRERGTISAELAKAWAAPGAAGKRYLLLSSEPSPNVFIRVIEGKAPPADLLPLTSWGWTGIEIIIDDPVALREQLRDSPFRVIGEPAPLGAFPTIKAFQVVGPSGEVLYLTAETGDRSKSILPPPGGPVGRIFIMVVGGPDIDALLDFYSSRFNLVRNPARMLSVGVIKRAQQLADGELTPLATARLAERGNLIEFDGYSSRTRARPTEPGQLPPGIVSTTFAVANLDSLQVEWLAPPTRHEGLAYQGKRAGTLRGPAGELIELIETGE